MVRFDAWNGRNSNCGNFAAMRCVTRRSNSSVVSVCWPVIMSSIGSRTMLFLGVDESLLDSVDSIRARNDGSFPVCATRLSVASAAAFSKVSGSFEACRRRSARRRKARAGRRRSGGRSDGQRRGRSFALPLEVVGFGGGDALERGLLQDLGAAGLALGGGRRQCELIGRLRRARRRGRSCGDGDRRQRGRRCGRRRRRSGGVGGGGGGRAVAVVVVGRAARRRVRAIVVARRRRCAGVPSSPAAASATVVATGGGQATGTEAAGAAAIGRGAWRAWNCSASAAMPISAPVPATRP